MAIQNKIDFEYTPQSLAPIIAAISALETFTEEYPVPTPKEKSRVARRPEDSVGWMNNMATLAEQRLELMPREFTVEQMRRDLKLMESLGPLLLRLRRICDKFDGAVFYAGSDAFDAALSVRRVAKAAGVAGVDDNLEEGMSHYFQRKPQPDDSEPDGGTTAPAT